MELGKYGMGAGKNNLPLPENDIQEFQELNGRVKAVLTYIEVADYPKPEVIYAMLGGGSDGLPVHQGE